MQWWIDLDQLFPREFITIPWVKHGGAGRQRVGVGQAGGRLDKSLLADRGGEALVAVRLLEPLLSLRLEAVSLLAESLGHTFSKLWGLGHLGQLVVTSIQRLTCFSLAALVSSGEVKWPLPSLGGRGPGGALRRGRHRVSVTHWGAASGGRLALGLLGVGSGGQRPVLLLPGQRLEGVRELPGSWRHLGELDGVRGVRVAVGGVGAGRGRARACPGRVGARRGRVGPSGRQRPRPGPRVSLAVGAGGLKKENLFSFSQMSQQPEQKIYCIFDSTSFCATYMYYSFLTSTPPHIFSAQKPDNSREKKNQL